MEKPGNSVAVFIVHLWLLSKALWVEEPHRKRMCSLLGYSSLPVCECTDLPNLHADRELQKINQWRSTQRLIFSTTSECLPMSWLMFKLLLRDKLFHKAALVLCVLHCFYFRIKLESSNRLWPVFWLTKVAIHYSLKCDTTSSTLQLQGCRHNKDTAGNQLCPLWYPFCQTEGVQIMKWPLRTDSFANYSLDRFAVRPWNQSLRMNEGGKLIPVGAQVVKPAEGFKVSYKLFAEVCGLRPWIQCFRLSPKCWNFFWSCSELTLDASPITTIFQIQSQKLFFFSGHVQCRSFLTKLAC